MSVIPIIRRVHRRVTSCLTTYRQGPRPNIAIFAIRRGGSTLLADMLGSEPGVLMVNEPFLVLDREWNTVRLRWLRPRLHSQIFDLDDEDRERMRAYVSAILRGKAGLGTCRNPKFPCRADRVVLKDLQAPALLDWLTESFGLRTVRLLRHPAPQALSVLRTGWGFGTEALFTTPGFLLSFLSGEQVEFGSRILAEPAPWPKAILDWCIRYHLLVHYSKLATPLITYEQLMLDPLATTRFLCEQLDLSDVDRIASAARKPSSSPGGCSPDTLSHLQSGDSWGLIQNWCRKVDGTQVKQAQEILDQYGVSFYNMSSPFPDGRPARVGANHPEARLEGGRRGHTAPAHPVTTLT